MTLHFEDRRKLRALAQPVEPQRELWAGIAARIETQARAPHRRRQWLALAASLACAAVIIGVVGVRMLHSPQPATAPAQIAAAANAPARWKPSDPRLRGAAVELRAAQGELRQALAIAPNSPYLQRLLHNTEHQQSRLRQLETDAG
ncbi:MAG TPA: hypothetical protein VFK08_04085 [Rhodanobacteraceae bacterium]|jgi:hypothetical protein|nr:hypothetical protein [Rhodanobacteraceae bacterium]